MNTTNRMKVAIAAIEANAALVAANAKQLQLIAEQLENITPPTPSEVEELINALFTTAYDLRTTKLNIGTIGRIQLTSEMLDIGIALGSLSKGRRAQVEYEVLALEQHALARYEAGNTIACINKVIARLRDMLRVLPIRNGKY